MSASSRSSPSDGWGDYLANLRGSDASGSENAAPAPAFGRGGEREAGLEGPLVEDMRVEGERPSTSSESSLADSEDNSEASSGPSASDVAEDLGDRLRLADAHPLGLPGGLDAPQMTPGPSGRKRRSRELSRGPGGGAPAGEARAAGAAGRRGKKRQKTPAAGVDLGRINRTLQDLVTNDGDIEAFPPMRKEGRERVRQLAALYGLKASEQRGRGEKRFVIVRVTKHSRLPGGRQAEELASLLRPPPPPPQQQQQPPPGARRGSGGGRKRRPRKGRPAQPGGEASSGEAGAEPRPRTVFVSRGLLEDLHAHELLQPLAAARRSGDAQPAAEPQPSGSQGSSGADSAMDSERCGDEAGSGEQPGPELGGLRLAGGGEAGEAPQGLRVAGSLVEAARSPVHAAGLSSEQYLARLEQAAKPSVLRTRAQCRGARKKLEKEQRRAERRDAGGPAPLRDQTGPLEPRGGRYGDFEQHTRGIGSKLLAQMGFAGRGAGLGREAQGIHEPLRAVARPKQLGLGA